MMALGLTLYPVISNYVNQKYASEIFTAYQEVIAQTDNTVLLQERIQSDMQGRIFSLLQIVVTDAMPLGMVLFGPLGDAIPIEVLLLATGLLLVLLGGGIYTHKALRRAGEPVIQEEPPTGESEAETE